MVEIDRKLNLVVPVDRGDIKLFVHAAPLSASVFEAYYMVISEAFTVIYSKGLSVYAAPRIAALVLRDIARASGAWEGPEGVENGLVAEMHRLSNVLMPVDGKGWQTMPYADAVARQMLSKEEQGEVEGAIVFFMVASAMHRRAELTAALGAMSLWAARLTSLNATEYAASLRTSTPADSSGAKATASSMPR